MVDVMPANIARALVSAISCFYAALMSCQHAEAAAARICLDSRAACGLTPTIFARYGHGYYTTAYRHSRRLPAHNTRLGTMALFTAHSQMMTSGSASG